MYIVYNNNYAPHNLLLMVIVSMRCWVVDSAHIHHYITLVQFFLLPGANYPVQQDTKK